MSSSYDKIRGGKLTFKNGSGLDKLIDKKIDKKEKKKKNKSHGTQAQELHPDGGAIGVDEGGQGLKKQAYEIDPGTGFAPDGKKSKKYEELFPVETKKFGYVVEDVPTREAALDERVKKKADRYCK